MKSVWARFYQWERVFFLREKEWWLPIHGSAEEFETRFKQSVPVVSRDEFFRLYKKRKNPKVLGFYGGDELALKVPNQRTAKATLKSVQWRRSVHYFHGILTRNDNELGLFGHYRLPGKRADRILGAINGGVLIFILALIDALAWLNAELLIDVLPTWVLFFIVVGPYVLFVTMVGLMFSLGLAIPGLAITRLRDRYSRAETRRLLQTICGKPEEEPAE